MELWFANARSFKETVDKARKRKLRPNQVWGFNIGNRINSVQERDFNRLLRYLDDKDDWHSPSATDHISLVLITENRRNVVAHARDYYGYGEEPDEEYEDEEDEE